VGNITDGRQKDNLLAPEKGKEVIRIIFISERKLLKYFFMKITPSA
jgi:hypothetical protein